MISPYQKWDLGPLQPVLPLLQRHLNHQQFLISNVMISFSWRQAAGEKGTGMELVVGGQALGKHGPTPTSEASPSTENCRSGSGIWRMGADVKRDFSSWKPPPPLVSTEK